MTLPSPRHPAWGWTLFATWLLIATAGAWHHEFWRDEVRAFSIAIDATSAPDLFRSLQDDGHPMLWHSILAIGYWLTASKLVLPVASLLICAGAVALICFGSPFPRWLQALFVLGGLPLYEYSVMARNYGISMLLMFTFAWLYPSRRDKPWRLGLVLALLANTNVHSLVFAGLLTALWLWDDVVGARGDWTRRRAASLFGAVSIAALGAALSLATIWPSDQLVLSDTSQGVAGAGRGALALLLHPAKQFNGLLMPVAAWPLVAGAILAGSLFALLPHLRLLVTAAAGLLGMSILFSVIYGGSYRHEGLWLALLMSLAWIARSAPPGTQPAPAWLRPAQRVGSVALSLLLALQVVTAFNLLDEDLRHEMSAGAAFGRYLARHPEYADAILVGEPDYYLETIRAYADNDVYILRERATGHVVHFWRATRGELTLQALVEQAWQLRQRTQRPVLLVLGHLSRLEPDAMVPPEGAVEYGWGHRTFSWTSAELWTLRHSTRRLRRFAKASGDERYTVYEVIAAPDRRRRPAAG